MGADDPAARPGRLRRVCGAALLPALLAIASGQATPVVSLDAPQRETCSDFVQHETRNAEEVRTFSPFFSQVRSRQDNKVRTDVLWPLVSVRSWHEESSGRILSTWYRDTDRNDPSGAYHVWVVPILGIGRSTNGLSYLGVFPIAGTLYDFMGMDEWTFTLFPLYSKSRVDDTVTESWLWPFYSHTHGPRIDRFRIWPFYGRSSELAGQVRRKFVLWPIWSQVHYDYRTSKGDGYVLFPIYGHVKLTDQETWWVLPPFFRHTVGARQSLSYYPWPFVQIARGENEKFWIWPFYGHKRYSGDRYQFILWPLYADATRPSGADTWHRWRLFPFLYSTRVTAPAKAGAPETVKARVFKFWPLVERERQGQDLRWRFLSLWPLNDLGPIERNLAPLWTLFDYRREAGNRETSLLWGLYRSRVAADGAARGHLFPLYGWTRDPARSEHTWSLLGGLAGYRQQGEKRVYRVLYFLKWGDRQP